VSGPGKERLDVLLVKKGMAATREKARRAIMAGEVMVDGVPETKPGTFVRSASEIELRPLKGRRAFVSRGGEKLIKALEVFEIDVGDKVTMDIGASTGGFTDCLLKHGAKRVYAIDVGYGQLAWELRKNPKVVVLERTNVRYLEPGRIPEPVDFITIDVSFISVVKFLSHLLTFLKDDGGLVILIKPQFEAGREEVQRGGVVRDPKVHIATIQNILQFMEDVGLEIKGLTYSPITGPAGNIEFLVYAIKREAESPSSYSLEVISKVVEDAHTELRNA
jgi:23S rRNA (cytidine1920-2'-O)/16S rRNA (cytidine1409-2'-O)-methyltransferase